MGRSWTSIKTSINSDDPSSERCPGALAATREVQSDDGARGHGMAAAVERRREAKAAHAVAGGESKALTARRLGGDLEPRGSPEFASSRVTSTVPSSLRAEWGKRSW